MKKRFSRSWIRSKQPRKQRKYAYNAPLHVLQKMMGAHLSKELKEKYETRTMIVRKDDTVKIVRGQFKGKTGKVERTSLKNKRVYVRGIELTKKDGTKKLVPLVPSNLIITELELSDKMRKKIIERKKGNGKKTS